jgi:hypothetical protein
MIVKYSEPRVAAAQMKSPPHADGAGRVEHWERSRFVTAPEPHPCPEVIDLTGRARHLFCGPWARLEPGLWRAKLRFELCEDAARRLLAVEFGGEESGWTLVDVPVGAAGPREVELEHKFLPGELALLRVLLKAAAFHGEFRFTSAIAQRLDEPLACADVNDAP